jgi:hypothetical protein
MYEHILKTKQVGLLHRRLSLKEKKKNLYETYLWWVGYI